MYVCMHACMYVSVQMHDSRRQELIVMTCGRGTCLGLQQPERTYPKPKNCKKNAGMYVLGKFSSQHEAECLVGEYMADIRHTFKRPQHTNLAHLSTIQDFMHAFSVCARPRGSGPPHLHPAAVTVSAGIAPTIYSNIETTHPHLAHPQTWRQKCQDDESPTTC